MLPQPHGEKIIFLEFSGFGTQIEGGQNMVSTVVTTVRDAKVLSKKRFLGAFKGSSLFG